MPAREWLPHRPLPALHDVTHPNAAPSREAALPAVALILLLALAPGACGGDDDGGGGGETRSIRALETAGAPSAFLKFGVDRGFFQEEGLDVSVQVSQGGAEAIPALVSGDIQIAGSNLVSVLLAANRGLDLQIVAPGTFARADNDFSAIMAREDGDIRQPSDLAGKRLAVNTLKNITEVTAREALVKEGVDVSTLKLRELPFPEMGEAVRKRQVDAAFLIEPFVTRAKQAGLQVVLRPFTGTRPDLQVGAYAAQTSFIDENPEVVDRFARGGLGPPRRSSGTPTGSARASPRRPSFGRSWPSG